MTLALPRSVQQIFSENNRNAVEVKKSGLPVLNTSAAGKGGMFGQDVATGFENLIEIDDNDGSC